MRRVSKKRRKLMDQVREPRRRFLSLHKRCMVCRQAMSSQVHEIARGASRQRALAEVCTWLAVCGPCNTNELTNYAIWPLAKQLAVKLVRDPGGFDLDAFNALRDRGPNAITYEEVMYWVDEIS